MDQSKSTKPEGEQDQGAALMAAALALLSLTGDNKGAVIAWASPYDPEAQNEEQQ